MPKANDKNRFPLNISIAVSDYLFGTRNSDGKNMSFAIADIMNLISASLGLSVYWLRATAEDGSLTSTSLIGNFEVTAILGENQLYTDFTAFPDFALDNETGEITGFPFTAGVEYLLSFKTITEDDEE